MFFDYILHKRIHFGENHEILFASVILHWWSSFSSSWPWLTAELLKQVDSGSVFTAPWVTWVSQGDICPDNFYFFDICSGPQEDPDICGTPILCMFNDLLMFIACLTMYKTLKGSTGGRQFKSNQNFDFQNFRKSAWTTHIKFGKRLNDLKHYWRNYKISSWFRPYEIIKYFATKKIR